MSRASKPAKQNGTSSAETIRASGHDRANRPYTRQHPDQARQTLTDPLQRGSHPHKTFEGRQANPKNADKLMALYLGQIDALDKHRGKGQHKMTVEHVYVEAGGQAVVGLVQSGAQPRRLLRKSAEPRAIGHQVSPS